MQAKTNSELHSIFSSRLQHLIYTKRYEIKDVADGLGCSSGCVSRWLSDNFKSCPSFEQLVKLSKFFDCPVGYFTGETNLCGFDELSVTLSFVRFNKKSPTPLVSGCVSFDKVIVGDIISDYPLEHLRCFSPEDNDNIYYIYRVHHIASFYDVIICRYLDRFFVRRYDNSGGTIVLTSYFQSANSEPPIRVSNPHDLLIEGVLLGSVSASSIR